MPRALRLARLILALLAVQILGLALAGSAFADAITPESGGSPNADEIDSLYKLILVLAVIVFLGVEGALIWALLKFKARKGAVAAQIHGNTRLEIGWTLGAAAILIFLTVFTFLKLPAIKNPAPTGPNGLQFASTAAYASTDQPTPPEGKALRIKVDGQQYVWRFQYPGKDDVFSYEEMVVPEETTVVLDISADDVAHSWWIPRLGGKMDALPGYINKTWFKAKRGLYTGQCAELCGRNHANMLARVRVLSVDEYEKWFEQRKADIKTAREEQAEARKKLEGDESSESGDEGASGAGAGTGEATTGGTGEGTSAEENEEEEDSQ
jgi:cytochrome c oxidase subunit 2